MCSLDFQEIENLVRLKHFEDSDYGNNKERCKELLDEVLTRNFKNSISDKIRLLSYNDTHLVSQDEDRLECMAQALFTTGSEGRFIFFIEIIDGTQKIGFRRP